jgi:hypothetical protein
MRPKGPVPQDGDVEARTPGEVQPQQGRRRVLTVQGLHAHTHTTKQREGAREAQHGLAINQARARGVQATGPPTIQHGHPNLHLDQGLVVRQEQGKGIVLGVALGCEVCRKRELQECARKHGWDDAGGLQTTECRLPHTVTHSQQPVQWEADSTCNGASLPVITQ